MRCSHAWCACLDFVLLLRAFVNQVISTSTEQRVWGRACVFTAVLSSAASSVGASGRMGRLGTL
jgi:hypothetical protein